MAACFLLLREEASIVEKLKEKYHLICGQRLRSFSVTHIIGTVIDF